MKLSRSTGYGLIAVGYIAKYGETNTAVLASTVAEEYDIPLEYLLKILQLLVRANVLRSKRGPRGGFYLTKPLEQTSLLEIIEAVDGPLESELQLPDKAKEIEFIRKISSAYAKVSEKSKDMLASTKLSDVIDRQQSGETEHSSNGAASEPKT